jgi:polysaccharide chain length determinant protein (PEP-CTERM system associated)
MEPTASTRVSIEQLFDQVRGAWRFRWLALIVAWTVAVTLWVIIFVTPDTYQATARVFVDANTTLSEVTRGISVEGDVDSQIQRVRQALLGGPQLEKVATETDLITGAVTARGKQEVIDRLREQIEISGSLSRDNAASGVYLITYKNRSRDKALQVVDRLLNTFVEGTLGGKRAGSEQAEQFLTTQIHDYEQRLATSEQNLADFKKRNVGLMPGAQGDYFTRVQAEMDALGKAQANLAVAQRRRDELQRQLRGETPVLANPGTSAAKPLPSASVGLSASSTPTLVGAGGGGASGDDNDIGSRIRDTQQKLDDMLLRYTDKHPDVIALRQTLKELQDRQQEEIDAVRRGDPGAADRSGLSANPVFQTTQLQYNQAQVDIAATQAEIADHEKKIADLRGLMNTAPEVEAEYTRLNRDYDVTKQQYQALVDRLNRTKLGQEAEATGIVKLEVIDPPTSSFTPVAPKRLPLLIGALLLALGAGGGCAYLLHVLRPVYLNARQLNGITGLPVLGVVSMLWLDKHRVEEKRQTLVYAGAAAALLCVAAVILTFQVQIMQVIRGLHS